ncbi:ABC transporter substrate-binding protein [Myxococcota bacterium]|nr:ABC transporter substrate-binding protein [Myxococcota bacterium]MBU1379500.1 ABC transporter substrate-binding protein [Myxococcota bacterium]MBU1497907.1 ABC transporter substrate-binding protein [Myxococcota bacterium]
MIRIYLFFIYLFLLSSGCKRIAAHKEKGIVSFSPSLTQMVYALGKGKQINCVTKYDEWPPEVRKLPKVGGFLDISMENILRCNPSVVLLTEMHGELAEKLKSMSIPHLELRTRNISEVLSSIRKLSVHLGAEVRGRELVADLEKQLKPKKCKSKKRFLITLGRSAPSLKNLVGAGAGTYLDELGKLAGGENVLESRMFAYPSIGMESLVQLNPDVIIDIVVSDGSSKDWDMVPFRKKPQIEIVVENHVYTPGIRMGKTLETFHKILCP